MLEWVQSGEPVISLVMVPVLLQYSNPIRNRESLGLPLSIVH